MHFMYTAPIPTPPVGALSAMPTLHMAVVGLCFAVAAFASIRLPRPAKVSAAAHEAPGPFYCQRTKRWRDPVTRRFVKSPR
jgi:hypothetical protein